MGDPPADPPVRIVACERCQAPVHVPVDPDLPRGIAFTALCPACAEATPITGFSPTRMFKVEISFHEAEGAAPPPNPADPADGETNADVEAEEVWTPIGGFVLRGIGESIRDFVNQHSQEWDRRMSAILEFGDAKPQVP